MTGSSPNCRLRDRPACPDRHVNRHGDRRANVHHLPRHQPTAHPVGLRLPRRRRPGAHRLPRPAGGVAAGTPRAPGMAEVSNMQVPAMLSIADGVWVWRVPPKNGLASRCLASRCLATGGMGSSLAGLGAARGWRRSCRFIASACATMMIVAAGSRFPEAKTPDRSSYLPTQSL